jgi:3-dehydroquinate dehydratase-2
MAGAPKILVVNGPNLNMLGVREPSLYGRDKLSDIEKLCRKQGRQHGLAIDFRQSNHEGEIVGWLQEARGTHAGIVVNAGAYTHTSVAILDALQLTELPIIEVHLSNIFRRESFRHRSYVSLAARAVICGLGAAGYRLAIDALAEILGTTKDA